MPKSLPAASIIKLGRFTWTTMWQVMMSQMAPRSKTGAYVRPESVFRGTIDADHPAAAGRYRLFVGMGCPWAHRTLIVRALKGLEAAIDISIVVPSADDGRWLLTEPYLNCQNMPELYQTASPGFKGRSTVPILFDETTKTIINNESAEIIEILNAEFNEFATHGDLDLYPAAGKAEIDRWNAQIYPSVNNGVYRCGFAQTQAAYDEAVNELFGMLDTIDDHLANQSFLWGEQITLADVRLFTTLIRFDSAYHGLFKCSRRRIRDYANLSQYVQRIYQLPGVADTCDFQAIQQDYYGNLFPLNPGGIVPTPVDMSWLA
ncbi:glutathione S-transferase family protein [Romeriopsis navalis]|uniref:glutathione S-transferase family protein n=1 Tax=Romeriopsis navalis TaxID=2992132 RepID=UPI0021F8AD0C|nr:glutathione S-transferase C-terminal domain-containing protein [Romeriopsis navalis]